MVGDANFEHADIPDVAGESAAGDELRQTVADLPRAGRPCADAHSGGAQRGTVGGRERERLPESIGFFPEWGGLVPRVHSDGGVIFRAISGEVLDGRVIPAPLSALMGDSEAHPPLLRQFMERMVRGARAAVGAMRRSPRLRTRIRSSLRPWLV